MSTRCPVCGYERADGSGDCPKCELSGNPSDAWVADPRTRSDLQETVAMMSAVKASDGPALEPLTTGQSGSRWWIFALIAALLAGGAVAAWFLTR